MLFLPWCTAQNFSVRCSAIAAIKCLWPLANEETQAKLPWLQKVTQFNAESNGFVDVDVFGSVGYGQTILKNYSF